MKLDQIGKKQDVMLGLSKHGLVEACKRVHRRSFASKGKLIFQKVQDDVTALVYQSIFLHITPLTGKRSNVFYLESKA